MTPGRPLSRLWAVPLIAALHLGSYFVVTRIVDRMPTSMLWDFTTPLDRLIPYWPWTWPLYWAAYPFVLVAGGAVLLRVTPRGFRLAVRAFVVMILSCAVLQVVFPAPAPWPSEPATSQRLMHSAWLMRRWATLPSMHVALCALTAALCWNAFRHWAPRAGAWLLTIAISASTLTLKEHVVADAVTGALAGATAGVWWRRASSGNRTVSTAAPELTPAIGDAPNARRGSEGWPP